MKNIIFLFFLILHPCLIAKWVYVDTASGQGEGQQTWIWETYSTSSENENYRKFTLLSVMPLPMEANIQSATSDVEVYCNAPTKVTMKNFKYYRDKKGVNILPSYSDNETVLKKNLPTYTPGYKAVRMVCKI